MSELSTRVWLDERLWDTVRQRAIAEGTTVRDLIPHLVSLGVQPPAHTATPAAPVPPARAAVPAVPTAQTPAAAASEDDGGPPLVAVTELYRCGQCGQEVKIGGLSMHLGKHLKERQAAQG